jgi:hypothetical protein
MAGALNAAAAPPQTTPAPYYGPPAGGGALSSMYGPIDPYAMGDSFPLPSEAPSSPYIEGLYRTGQELIGEPGTDTSPLAQYRQIKASRDAAVAQKMAAITRAMSFLSNTQGGDRSNLPLMLASAGLLQPTRTGTIGESIGNAASAAVPEITRQREIERQLASGMGQLGIEGADVPLQAVSADEADLQNRIRLGEEFGSAAARAQAQADMAHARLATGYLTYKGRIDSAALMNNRNRWKFIGNDPNDPSVGRYIDQNDPSGLSVVAGPAAGGKPAAPSAGEWKYNVWLKNHPGDTAGAEDFVSGRRKVPPEQLRAWARADAEKELGLGADPDDLNSKTSEIYGFLTSPSGGGAAPPSGGGQPSPAAPPTTPGLSPDQVKQSLDNARKAIAAGKPRDAVLRRLRDAGIDTSGL